MLAFSLCFFEKSWLPCQCHASVCICNRVAHVLNSAQLGQLKVWTVFEMATACPEWYINTWHTAEEFTTALLYSSLFHIEPMVTIHGKEVVRYSTNNMGKTVRDKGYSNCNDNDNDNDNDTFE